MSSGFPLLSAAIWIPIVFGVFLLALGNDRSRGVVRGVALAGALAGLLPTWQACQVRPAIQLKSQ